MNMKKCTKCLKEKPLESFLKRSDSKSGVRSHCIDCTRASNSNRYHTKYKGPSHRKRGYKYVLKTKYNLTVEEYSKMLELQDHKCPICNSTLEDVFKHKEGKRAAVDHCHDTGKVRGVLCGTCNTGLGGLQDSKELLNNAILYLEKSST